MTFDFYVTVHVFHVVARCKSVPTSWTFIFFLTITNNISELREEKNIINPVAIINNKINLLFRSNLVARLKTNATYLYKQLFLYGFIRSPWEATCSLQPTTYPQMAAKVRHIACITHKTCWVRAQRICLMGLHLQLHNTYSIEQNRLEKLTGFQLYKKFPAFYGTRRFITASSSAHHLSLSWARSIQSIHHTSLPEDTS